MDKPLRFPTPPLWRRQQKTKKARSVVALSCVPHGGWGSPVSPPAAGLCRGSDQVPITRFLIRELRLEGISIPLNLTPDLRRLCRVSPACPPTSTRPQARAKLGRRCIRKTPPLYKRFFMLFQAVFQNDLARPRPDAFAALSAGRHGLKSAISGTENRLFPGHF
jgi:hypothetical protein